MAAIFTPTANLGSKLTLLALAAVFFGAMGWWWLWPRMDYVRHVRATINQPVPFSHQHHVVGTWHRLSILSHGGRGFI